MTPRCTIDEPASSAGSWSTRPSNPTLFSTTHLIVLAAIGLILFRRRGLWRQHGGWPRRKALNTSTAQAKVLVRSSANAAIAVKVETIIIACKPARAAHSRRYCDPWQPLEHRSVSSCGHQPCSVSILGSPPCVLATHTLTMGRLTPVLDRGLGRTRGRAGVSDAKLPDLR